MKVEYSKVFFIFHVEVKDDTVKFNILFPEGRLMQRKVRMVFGNMTSESLQVFMETTKAIRKLSKYKEGVSVETPIFVPSGIGMFYKIIYVNL